MNARRSTDLSQWLSRPNAGDAARRAQPAHLEAAPGIVFSRLSGAAPDGGEGAGSGDPGSLDRRRLHPPGRRAGSRDGHDRLSKSSVSKLCKDIDERVNGFLTRPMAGEWPYLWLDATYLKVRAAVSDN